MAYATRIWMFVSSLEFQAGLCLYVTAAVKAASHIGTAYVAAAAEVCSRFIGTCRELSPPPSPSLPLSFFASWGFPEWNIQDHPFLSLVCPWTIVRSWEHLPFSPLPFSPSLFLSFSLSSLHPLPWVSLDAFVLPFWCVPGRLCRSWEHLCFLLSFPLFSSSPSPLFPRARRVYKQTRLLQQVFLMRFGCHRFVPVSAPTDVFSFFSFMSFCLHVSSSSSFLSLARTIVRTLVYTHTRTRTLLTTRFRWPRFVTMRFGSSVVPLHLVLLHRGNDTHTCVCLVLFIFICPFCAHMCLASFPGRMEATHASLQGGVCV